MGYISKQNKVQLYPIHLHVKRPDVTFGLRPQTKPLAYDQQLGAKS